uniref:Uncharacterized protein n=1 Tax=Panagrellus redivivus TaxID=6233 RepID=A0A7E4VRC5_PANRE
MSSPGRTNVVQLSCCNFAEINTSSNTKSITSNCEYHAEVVENRSAMMASCFSCQQPTPYRPFSARATPIVLISSSDSSVYNSQNSVT